MIDIINEGIVFKVSDDHKVQTELFDDIGVCLLYTSPSPRDHQPSRMPSSA